MTSYGVVVLTTVVIFGIAGVVGVVNIVSSSISDQSGISNKSILPEIESASNGDLNSSDQNKHTELPTQYLKLPKQNASWNYPEGLTQDQLDIKKINQMFSDISVSLVGNDTIIATRDNGTIIPVPVSGYYKNSTTLEFYKKNAGPFLFLSGIGGLKPGAGPGFIGGGVSFGAPVRLYHLYRQFRKLLECQSTFGCSKPRLEEANLCTGFCPDSAFCDCGICRCKENWVPRFGRCFPDTKVHAVDQKYPKPCFQRGCTRQGCHFIDMNMVCKNSKCVCRDLMKWNPEVRECQVFIDFNCASNDIHDVEIPVIFNASSLVGLQGDPKDTCYGSQTYQGLMGFAIDENGTYVRPKLHQNTATAAEISSTFCRLIARTLEAAPTPLPAPSWTDSWEDPPFDLLPFFILVGMSGIALGCCLLSRLCPRPRLEPRTVWLPEPALKANPNLKVETFSN